MGGGQSGIYSSNNCMICGATASSWVVDLCDSPHCKRAYESDLTYENLAYNKAAEALREWHKLEWDRQDPLVENAIKRAMKNILALRRIE